eukprot:gnl/Spiro4/14375_TR7739_c0_g1_i1.p1 gnl/Spiro4/14375_TR7739_c0_g1~~gnl/Spiro4/14375_TR7739_c0_g1_i1.p1  ORF type:complete len:251 (+),score=10.80 gnl/Spiro4/14375_TR7739_c0_g1_i1:157-909(+)
MTSSVSFVDVVPEFVDVFKVVGDESLVQPFLLTPRRPPPPLSDWSALYVQLERAHSEGTLTYRFEAGYQTANLLTFRLQSPLVRVITDPEFRRGDLSGHEKASRLKHAFGIPQDSLLMPWLGEHGARDVEGLCRGIQDGKTPAVLAVEETEGEWELIVPLPLVFSCECWKSAEQRVIAEYRHENYLNFFVRDCSSPALKWSDFGDGCRRVRETNPETEASKSRWRMFGFATPPDHQDPASWTRVSRETVS